MKNINVIFLAGLAGTFSSISVFAVPLDVTLIGGVPTHYWGGGVDLGLGAEWQDEDLVNVTSQSQPVINLAGVNSIQVTWQAPAGYMYVVNAPPSDVGNLNLQFEASYGFAGQASSLGSLTSSGFSINTIYGTSPLVGNAGLNNNTIEGGVGYPALDFLASTVVSSSTKPFAFNSLTITADFSGTGASGTTLDKTDWNQISGFFGVLYGIQVFYGAPYDGPPDPGQLLTLEPLPAGGSVPDVSPTLSLAGLGFAGLLLLRRKLPPVNG
jgi:VPDSG-CTERM motif